MSEVNLSSHEQDALRAFDARALALEIEKCLKMRSPSAALRDFPLHCCGLYICRRLRAFEAALSDYNTAKASKKVAETERRARLAGSALVAAVEQMQHRVEMQAEEVERFFVEDRIVPPSHFSQQLSVRVGYRWRPSIHSEWTDGAITFVHVYDPPSDFTAAAQKRRPSAAQRERREQEELWRQWSALKTQGLHALTDYFRNGGIGVKVPKAFRARAGVHDRSLNNFSCHFWLEAGKTTS